MSAQASLAQLSRPPRPGTQREAEQPVQAELDRLADEDELAELFRRAFTRARSDHAGEADGMNAGIFLADAGNIGLVACAAIDTIAAVSYASGPAAGRTARGGGPRSGCT